MMQRKSFDTVWEALESDPAEAANLAMRSELMIAIETRVRVWKVTQAEAAARLGLTQPRLNDLLRGKLDKFSLDALVNLAIAAGLKVRLAIAKPARR